MKKYLCLHFLLNYISQDFCIVKMAKRKKKDNFKKKEKGGKGKEGENVLALF